MSDDHAPATQKLYLRRAEAAEYLQERYGAYKTQTLAKMAVEGSGPRWRKMGAFAYYLPADLDEWAAERMSAPVKSTTELAHLSAA
jgi:hypothetical protein